MSDIKKRLEKIRLAVKSQFSNLSFNEEQHRYSVNSKNLKSVSATISQFVEPFDAYKIAGFVAKKRSREEGRVVTRQEILDEWEAKKNFACTKGTNVHLFGESFVEDFKSNPTNGYERAIVNFWDSIPSHIYPFLFELQMYCEDYGIAGTADIILYNSITGKFIIADYKTNIDLFKNHKGKTLLAPFTNMLDMPYSKYILQLSYYQLLLQKAGLEVESRRVIWLREDGTFEMYSVEDYTEQLKNTF